MTAKMKKATGSPPPCNKIYVSYGDVETQLHGQDFGYMESLEFEDDNGLVARARPIPANQPTITWFCDRQFVLLFEDAACYQQLSITPGTGATYYLNWPTPGPNPWAAVKSTTKSDANGYYSVNLTIKPVADPKHPIPLALKYRIIPYPAWPHKKRRRSHASLPAASSLVAATITVQT